MATNIKFKKEVFNKEQYKKVIDTEFSQLGVKTIQEQIDDQPTIEEFFNLYSELFYDIPENGDINSHEYLIKTSSEYINFDEVNEQILILQEEIAQLRVELLESQKSLAEARTST